MNDKKQVKYGALLSYFLIIVNTVYGLIMTPYIVSSLGEGQYGVYKIVASISASVAVLDLGLGSTCLRYVAKYNAGKEKAKTENFIAMSLVQCGFISAVIIIVCAVIYFLIPRMYANTMTAQDIALAKQLFIGLVINMGLHIFENIFQGVISGHNKFTISNSLKLGRVVIRIILLYIVLAIYPSAKLLVGVDIFMTVLLLVCELVYIKMALGLKIRLKKWDNRVFRESLKYSVLMFIQAIVAQINTNLDNVIIGAFVSTVAVTIYAYGLQLFSMFQQLAVSISSVMLPTIMKKVHNNASNEELENTVIKVGRIQFMLLGAAVAGFIAVGREFILLWLGQAYSNVWIIALVLMIPSMFELVQNVCLSILRAQNRMKFKTFAVLATAVLNLVITIVLVKKYGYVSACYGTAISYVIGNIVIMNIYYQRVIKLNIFRIFRNIFKRTGLCLVLPFFAAYSMSRFISGSWVYLAIKVCVFALLYGICMIVYGFNDFEKNLFFGKLLRVIKRDNA
ncbi:MAG: lipopolysaccharide biosynthesis protein [Acutalibacteraceae bacterium]